VQNLASFASLKVAFFGEFGESQGRQKWRVSRVTKVNFLIN